MPDKKILFSEPAACFPENILQETEQAQENAPSAPES